MTPEERKARKAEIQKAWDKALNAPSVDKQLKGPARKKVGTPREV